ncbi:hypothetical protein VP01_50g2 [Puccinia sorghi]|uniref:Uncharacterized protein n=1 Tax=Puccinia sorghi TaxID=27349 RepID=A0A0L6UL92_9BASI|nr:hypothetical protein VP01_50g2 [Puccinia sorghi]
MFSTALNSVACFYFYFRKEIGFFCILELCCLSFFHSLTVLFIVLDINIYFFCKCNEGISTIHMVFSNTQFIIFAADSFNWKNQAQGGLGLSHDRSGRTAGLQCIRPASSSPAWSNTVGRQYPTPYGALWNLMNSILSSILCNHNTHLFNFQLSSLKWRGRDSCGRGNIYRPETSEMSGSSILLNNSPWTSFWVAATAKSLACRASHRALFTKQLFCSTDGLSSSAHRKTRGLFTQCKGRFSSFIAPSSDRSPHTSKLLRRFAYSETRWTKLDRCLYFAFLECSLVSEINAMKEKEQQKLVDRRNKTTERNRIFVSFLFVRTKSNGDVCLLCADLEWQMGSIWSVLIAPAACAPYVARASHERRLLAAAGRMLWSNLLSTTTFTWRRYDWSEIKTDCGQWGYLLTHPVLGNRPPPCVARLNETRYVFLCLGLRKLLEEVKLLCESSCLYDQASHWSYSGGFLSSPTSRTTGITKSFHLLLYSLDIAADGLDPDRVMWISGRRLLSLVPRDPMHMSFWPFQSAKLISARTLAEACDQISRSPSFGFSRSKNNSRKLTQSAM